MGDTSKVKIEPCTVSWGRPQTTTVTTVADSSGSLNSKYFHLYTALDAIHYYVWYNINAAGVDPAISGATGVEITGATDATAATLATATKTAIDALAGFSATVSNATVTIINAANGRSTDASDGAATTGFTFATSEDGAGGDLGFTDGDIEIAFVEDLAEVKAHQTGSKKLTDIRTGSKIDEVKITFKETTTAQLRDLLNQGGSVLTPNAGTEVIGWGNYKQFTQTLDQAEKLVLHPVVLAAGTLTRDWAFWLAYPMVNSIKLSAENPMMVECTFKIYPDTTKNSKVQYMVYGDHTQTLT